MYSIRMAKLLNTFGKRVLALRKDEGYDTQIAFLEALEEKTGETVSQGHWSGIENSDNVPNGRVVAAIADLLGTTADFLLMRTDDPFPPGEESKPTFITLEAEQVASIVDEIRSERRRREILRMAEGMLGEDEASRMVDVIGNNERELRSFLVLQQSKRSPEDFKSLLDDWKQLFDDLDLTGNE